MTAKSSFVDAAVAEYAIDMSLREPELLRELRDETARMPNSGMQIGPEQGQFMRLLAQLIGAKRYLEIGVFTGYSSLSVALGLPADGRIVACDVSEEYTRIARRYWERAGVAGKIDLRLAPATETLRDLQAGPPFDMAFIDADKERYDEYYEGTLRVLRTNGLILIDNVLWGGRIVDENDRDSSTLALRALNEKIVKDERVDAV
ncbi:MAG: O-methyltransferase, partial [Vulcanimicrobiaceae bacterium]